MLIKLDENLSDTHTKLLRQRGYECDRVPDEGLSGATDEIVWQRVCQEKRFLLPSIWISLMYGVFPPELIQVFCFCVLVAVASRLY